MFYHNNFKIEFNTENEQWYCSQLNLTNSSYNNLINEINNYSKKIKNILSVYYWEYKDEPIEIKLTEINGSRGFVGIFPDKTYPVFVNPKYIWPLTEEMKLKIETYVMKFA